MDLTDYSGGDVSRLISIPSCPCSSAPANRRGDSRASSAFVDSAVKPGNDKYDKYRFRDYYETVVIYYKRNVHSKFRAVK